MGSTFFARYPHFGVCSSIIIVGNRLYIDGKNMLHVFEESASLTEPLQALASDFHKDKDFQALESGS